MQKICRLATSIRGVRELATMVHTVNGSHTFRDVSAVHRSARDFRSDTLTVPTSDMFAAMESASRGDDVYTEDETTNAFQERVARMTGKEAGLFCSSGTLTNQLAIRTHLQQPPHSVLCDHRAHIHRYEAGGIAFHSQATAIPVQPKNGHHLTLDDDILPNIVEGTDVHECTTRLVCLENTLSGMVFPQDEIEKIAVYAHTKGMKFHLDGARIWEVAAKTGKPLDELCGPFDSVSLCLSKGLGAPVGSILVGSKVFIAKARWFRKLFGGGTRQCGLLAAAAEYCLDHHLPQLPRVHALASHMATEFAKLGSRVLLPTETNMVFIDTTPMGFTLTDLSKRAALLPDPIIVSSGGPGGARLVVHHQTSKEAVLDLIELAREMKTVDAPVDEHSMLNAQGKTASAEELNDVSRPGHLRKRTSVAHEQQKATSVPAY